VVDDKQAVKGFLRLCVRYADDSIARKEERLGTDAERGGDKSGLAAWKAYRDFTAHAIQEIDDGVLEEWFEHLQEGEDWRPSPDTESGESGDSATAGGKDQTSGGGEGQASGDGREGDHTEFTSIATAGLGFEQRRALLDGIISPRPLVLASTRSGEGIDNLAGLSSLAVVSNNPPLVAISLSQDRDGRKRDTLVNLGENGRITLHILPSSREMAAIVAATSKALPADESEWGIIEVDGAQSPTEGDWPATFPLALAALECELLQSYELPEGAVAELCILGVRNILAPANTISAIQGGATLSSLCQHGSYRLTPAPDGWGYDCQP
jgi:flavin reductase (DIM6/NTAB) family NADH-FMN oxidoreductase RutF